MKSCNNCGALKPLSEYHSNPASKDGRCNACKVCACARSLEWRTNNREREKARAKIAYQRNREQRIERANQWRKNNLERRREIVSKYAKAHKAENRAKAKRLRKQSPDLYRAIGRRAAAVRREREFAVDVQPVDRKWWQAIFDIFETGLCVYCGKSANLTMDHFIPISRGGATIPGNLVACCQSCNSSKNNLLPETWVKERCGEHGYQWICTFLNATKEAYEESIELEKRG